MYRFLLANYTLVKLFLQLGKTSGLPFGQPLYRNLGPVRYNGCHCFLIYFSGSSAALLFFLCMKLLKLCFCFFLLLLVFFCKSQIAALDRALFLLKDLLDFPAQFF